MPPKTPSTFFSPSRYSLRGWTIILFICGGIYGFSLGLWRSPLQGVYTSIKFPLMVMLVILGNALLNTLTGLLMGIPMRFRQTVQILTTCFAIFSMVLASCVPVFLFFIFTLPATETGLFYELLLLSHVGLIALAGCASHLRLFDTVTQLCGSRGKALRLMVCWLSANLLLGAQLSWNLRPFFGTPAAAVEFLREDPFERNFFEAIYMMSTSATQTLLQQD